MLSQRKFVKGLNASTPYTNQPQGSIPRGSGLVLTKRGGLRVNDGSTTLTLENGQVQFGHNPIVDVALVQIPGVVPFYVGLIRYPPNSQGIYVYNFLYLPPNYYDFHANAIAPVGSGSIYVPGATPRILQFNNDVIITFGNNWLPVSWCGINAQTYAGLGPWQANTVVPDGSYISVVNGADNNNYIFRAYVLPPGTTGSTVVWNFTTGATVADNNVTWTCLGRDIPVPIQNSFNVVYPQWVSNVPIASNSVIQAGFYGTNSLRYWVANSTTFKYGTNYIIDSNNNVQVTTGGGTTTGAAEPIWNTSLNGTTNDNGLTWTCLGPATFYNFLARQGGTTSSGSQPPYFPLGLGTIVTDNNVVWANTGLTATSALPPRGARAAVVYAGSLWVLNTSPVTTSDGNDGPTALRMSELNNVNSWNPLNIAFLGKDDGTVGTGLATFTIAESGITPTGSLVAFKDYSTYQIIGVFGSANFSIIQAQTDMGCIATNTIQFIPGFGIARLTHLGPAFFDGVRDRIFGEEIRPYIFGEEDDITPVDAPYIAQSWAAQSTNPPMYVLACPMPGSNGALTRLFCYDLILKAWATPIDLPWPIACLRQIRQTGNGLAVATLCGGYSDGSVRQLFNGAAAWQDTPSKGSSQPVSFSVQSPEVFGKSTADKIFMRELYVRGTNCSGGVTATISFDTGDSATMPMKQLQLNNGEFEAYLQYRAEGKSVHAIITGNGPGELHTFDWDIEPAPAAPLTLL